MTQSPSVATPRLQRLQGWVEDRQRSFLVVLSLVALAAVVVGVNLGGAPRITALEGSNTAQAWTWLNLTELNFAGLGESPLSYASPSLGWLQLAEWTRLSGAFQRYDSAVFAGRVAVTVAHLLAIPLLWLLARKLGLARPFAAAAVIVFALSPLAVHAHRSVAFANLATPWLLGAWLLALAHRRQAVAFAGAASCFAIATLSQPSYVIFLPLVAWSMWRTATRESRAVRVSLAAVVLTTVYVAYWLATRWLGAALPTGAPPLDGVLAQANRAGGALFTVPADGFGLALELLRLDPVLVILAPLSAVVCLFRRSKRPLAVSLITLAILLLTPVALAVSSALVILALSALAIAGAAEILWSVAQGVKHQRWRLRSVAAVAVLAAAVAAAVPLWGIRLDGLLRDEQNRPMTQARGWIADNVGRDSRLIVGPDVWVELPRSGFGIDHVTSSDPSFYAAGLPRPDTSWRDYEYVIDAASTLGAATSDTAERAVRNSQVVAQFGEGDQTVSVRQVLPDGVAEARASERADLAERRAAGAEVIRNPSLRLAKPVRELIAAGQLDPRALVLLTRAAATGTLQIDALPEVAGEAGNDRPRRQVLISGRDGAFLDTQEGEELAKTFTEQGEKYRPSAVRLRAGSLLLTWNLDYPHGLFG